MLCLICKTPILNRDNFLWRYNTSDADQSDGGVHDDCMIRDYEFAEEYIKAGNIYRNSETIYKTLPKI